MGTYTRTITASQDPAMSKSAAEEVANNLRAAGNTVEIGEPYENVTVRHYGMSSVDLTVTEPDPNAPRFFPDQMRSDEVDAELAKDEASNAPDLTEDNVLGNDR